MLRSPCTVCAASHSDPANFLLHCSSCATVYHHDCHTPALEPHELFALVKASTHVRNGSKDPREIAHNLQTWQCATCAKIVSAPNKSVGTVDHPQKPIVIDLSISDSDDEQPIQPERKQQAAVSSESVPVQIEHRAIEGEKVKIEESATLPPAKYNLAPNWIYKQHSESQTIDSWDRLARKKPAHRPRKGARPAVKHASSEPFVLSASLWLQNQRSSLPV
ncbi:hypothetical protein H0H92_004505 [Tricholoma furcatifolium]|nr:hypothetical protein H0H92_004505 [Tricholoma furcatifolium]